MSFDEFDFYPTTAPAMFGVWGVVRLSVGLVWGLVRPSFIPDPSPLVTHKLTTWPKTLQYKNPSCTQCGQLSFDIQTNLPLNAITCSGTIWDSAHYYVLKGVWNFWIPTYKLISVGEMQYYSFGLRTNSTKPISNCFDTTGDLVSLGVCGKVQNTHFRVLRCIRIGVKITFDLKLKAYTPIMLMTWDIWVSYTGYVYILYFKIYVFLLVLQNYSV